MTVVFLLVVKRTMNESERPNVHIVDTNLRLKCNKANVNWLYSTVYTEYSTYNTCIGLMIQRQLDGLTHHGTITVSAKVKSLSSLEKKVKVGERKVYIEKTTFFSRLAVLSQREEDVESNFTYELTKMPLSLFDDKGLMRKPEKPCLEATSRRCHCQQSCQMISVGRWYIVDGGWLLHQVMWYSGTTWITIARSYVSYIKAKYGTRVTVVFDGYGNTPSTKDSEHQRRVKSNCALVTIKPAMKNIITKQKFLSNEQNKKQVINLIAEEMAKDGSWYTN